MNNYQKELYQAIEFDYGKGLADFVITQKKPDCCDSSIEHYFSHSLANNEIHLNYIMEPLRQIEQPLSFFQRTK
jgi:hypothetical protein